MQFLPLRTLGLLLLLPLLSSCIGGVVVYPTDMPPLEYPWIHGNKGGYSSGRRLKAPEKCSAVMARWGQADHQTVDGNATTFVYKKGFAWAGIVPMIMIPIPLVVPVATKSTSLVCENGVVMRASGTETVFRGGYCGLISEEPRWGCKSEKPNFDEF
jgi:hypothetical protein